MNIMCLHQIKKEEENTKFYTFDFKISLNKHLHRDPPFILFLTKF